MRYGARSALVKVDLSFSRGISVLLGPNGSGKTTLINCIAGDKRPASGEVAVCRLNPARSRRDVMRLLGVLPQDSRLPRASKASELVMYAAWLKGCSGKESASLANAALDAVGLAAERNLPARKLSGGMQRRVAIAAAVVHRPQVLLLDEPMSGLDPAQRAGLRTLIRELAGESCVLLTTHILQDVPEIADRVTVLTDGSVRFDGSFAQFAAKAGVAGSGESSLESAYQNIVAPDPQGDSES